jgi:hypothetical protein
MKSYPRNWSNAGVADVNSRSADTVLVAEVT